MLLELFVGTLLLGTLLVLINQSLVSLHRQHRLADRQFVAQQVLENHLEEALQLPWKSLSNESVQAIKLPLFAKEKLPGCQLVVEVLDIEEPVPAKQVTLRLTWRDRNNPGQKPIALTTWAYPPEENLE